MLVFGTRPEAIKMAPVIDALRSHEKEFITEVTVTGQHRQMLDSVLGLFGIKPDYDLDIMRPGQDLYDLTARMLTGMRDVLAASRPDIVLVHGDTATSTTAALAAFYARIPVGHVEAGLRTGDIYSPFPEEMNRRLTGRLATYHFTPTETSCGNLLRENVDPADIVVTGNTVIDALHSVRQRLESDPEFEARAAADVKALGYDITARLAEPGRRMVLITGHRRENFGRGFEGICKGLDRLASRYPDVDFVYPMHLNPNVRKPIADVFGDGHAANMHFIEPVDYLGFVYMMTRAYLIMTDSGGIQEEAPSLGKPVLVFRDVTERPEAVAAGTVTLVGTDPERIVAEASLLLDDSEVYERRTRLANPYGDGHAARRIADFLATKF